MKLKAAKHILYCLIFMCFFCAACKRTQEKHSRTVFLLGTVCTIQLFTDMNDEKAASILQQCIERIEVLDRQLSANTDHSMLMSINKQAGIEPFSLPEDIAPLFKRAAFFAKATQGAFNPVIGSIVKLWNIGFETAHVPNIEELNNALLLTDYTDFELSDRQVFLKKKGVQLDLGAIAKGFVGDEVAKIIRAAGITSALIDIGGTITALGEKQHKKPWTIGIRDPRQQQGNAILSIEATNKSIATSGVYERFFIENGVQYHHIIDPKTGRPVRNKLLSVSIISDNATDADALSTACFVLGYEASLPLLNSFSNTEAIFIFDDNTICTTKGLSHHLHILHTDFHHILD